MASSSGPAGRLLTGYLLMVVTAVFWAGAWITARIAAHDVPPVTVAAGRFVVASAALLPFWWAIGRRREMRLTRFEGLALLGMTVTGVVLYNILFLVGIRFAPASDGLIITPGLAGLFALLVAWATLGEQPAPRVAAGAFLSFLGVLLVGWSSLRTAGTDPNRVLGDVLYAASALCWGVYTVLGRRISGRVPAVTSILLTSVAGAVILAGIALLTDGVPDFASWERRAWINVVYLGTFATAIGFVTYYLAVQFMGVGRTAATMGLVPALGVLGAAGLLNETLTLLHAAGGLLVITGIALSGTRRRGVSRSG